MASLITVLMAGIRSGDAPLASGVAYTYSPGTTTPLTTYTTNALSVANANPIVLDAEGRAEAYVANNVPVRVRVLTAVGGSEVIDIDPAEHDNTFGLSSVTADTTTDDYFSVGVGVTADVIVQEIVESINNKSTHSSALDARYLHAAGTGAGARGRTIYNRLSDVFNVFDFGATGDGTTSDTAAIQAAIDAAESRGGGVVWLPAGARASGNFARYLCGQLTLTNSNGVTFRGDGPGSIIRASNTTPLIVVDGTSANVLIADLQLQGASTGGADTAYAITIASTCSRVTVRDVWITAGSGGAGFNRGVVCAGARCTIKDVKIDSLVTPSGGEAHGIECDTSTRLLVSGCDINCSAAGVTGIGAGVNGTPAAASLLRIDNCTVNAATNAGVLLAASTTNSTVTGGVFNGCTQAGIRLRRATNCTVSNNVCYSNTNDGIRLDEDGTNGADFNTVTGNQCNNNTRNGIRIENTANNTTGPPYANTVANNTCAQNGQEGIWCNGDDNLIGVNNLAENSLGNTRTYAQVEITTANPSGTDRGGNRNALIGNNMRELPGTTEAVAGVRVRESGGGGVTNVSSTVLLANAISVHATNGTPLPYIYDASYTGSPQNFMANALGNSSTGTQVGGGGLRPWRDVATTQALTHEMSGAIITNTGAGGAVTVTLPDLAGDNRTNGMEFIFIRTASQTLTVAAGSGDTLVRRDISTGSISMTGTTDQITYMVSRGTSWYCDIVDYTT